MDNDEEDPTRFLPIYFSPFPSSVSLLVLPFPSLLIISLLLLVTYLLTSIASFAFDFLP